MSYQSLSKPLRLLGRALRGVGQRERWQPRPGSVAAEEWNDEVGGGWAVHPVRAADRIAIIQARAAVDHVLALAADLSPVLRPFAALVTARALMETSARAGFLLDTHANPIDRGQRGVNEWLAALTFAKGVHAKAGCCDPTHFSVTAGTLTDSWSAHGYPTQPGRSVSEGRPESKAVIAAVLGTDVAKVAYTYGLLSGVGHADFEALFALFSSEPSGGHDDGVIDVDIATPLPAVLGSVLWPAVRAYTELGYRLIDRYGWPDIAWTNAIIDGYVPLAELVHGERIVLPGPPAPIGRAR